jgi:hypothetical protein
MINYQQHIDDLVSWYVNEVLSSILFSPNNMLPLIVGNLVTLYYAHSQENKIIR